MAEKLRLTTYALVALAAMKYLGLVSALFSMLVQLPSLGQ